MAANLLPISSDGGFTSGGNINLAGNLNLSGGNIVQSNNDDLLLTAFDNDGIVSSSLELSPNNILTRIEQWSGQDSNSWTTADWATGTYTIQAGLGAVQFTGAATIIEFVNSLVGVGHIYFSVNGGPLLVWDGASSGATNITFYTPTLPATDPTTVTSFDYYYSYKSGFEIDYDSSEVNIYANDADINLQTTNNKDISLDSSGEVTITANSSSTWTFDTTGNLSLPGDIIGPSSANFTIYSNAAVHEFIFGDDGTFYAPDNVVLGGNSIYIGPGANTLTGIEHEVFIASSNHFAYIQAVVNNVSDNGSADWVALGARGNDLGGQATLGFTSSGFGDANYTITGQGDGYVFAQSYVNGQAPGGKGGNLVLATGQNGTVNDIIFGTGGFLTSNIFGRISNANNSFELSRANATITFPDGSIQSTAYTGGSGNTGNVTFDNINVIGTGNLNLQPNPADASRYLDIYLTGAVDIHVAAGAAGANLILGTDEEANVAVLQGGNVSIQAGNVSGTKTWNFDTTGNLTIPGGLIGSGASPAPYISGFDSISSISVSASGNISANNFTGNGGSLSNVATKVAGSWTLASGTNTVSISVPLSGTYSIWVNGNIPNGIITYTATAVVTNTNVPVLGDQYGWYYAVGNALVLTSIPNQFVGTAGAISNVNTYLGNTANVFTFAITNNSGANAVVNYGYTKL